MLIKKACLMLATLLIHYALAADDGPVSWSYAGDTAPEHWGSLSAEFATCKGYNQTPINITNTIKAKLPSLNIRYTQPAQTLLNNGHTIEVGFPSGNDITVDNETFTLKQMHFHTPSENHIEGQSFPMELHLVHANADGALAVIAVMFTQGEQNPALAKLWKHLPNEHKTIITLPQNTTVSAATFIPENQDYYRFSGSLTTPPCTEGVRWLVMKQPTQASKAQIDAFDALMGTHTNRPLQPLNGRIILH